MKRIFLMIAVCSVTIFAAKAQSATQTAFGKTLQAYFETKNALATDNVAKAGAGAKNLLAGLAAFPVKTLPATQQAEWKKQSDELKKYATPIVAEKDLKAQRKSFENVSSAMIKLVKAVNLNSNEVYVQYCPMVKRSWLNEVEAVQNPFYGSKMYDCGEVTETIAKK
ncbi:DUF3347 domain-containing protein [Pedobacter sp. KR3-3]|uniref:DUF3347 domain-containing protein n=1 Tax=Pedobacter albus TaxID=3113905 RepID=A0ABU7IAU8_9SPHI|nr:DUF3347 domain-containing protein [Pedobacter sp. KR3-3]MEE1946492.1 DUF3347 domain-containing protein [Pedobacter sp. KR3-3]